MFCRVLCYFCCIIFFEVIFVNDKFLLLNEKFKNIKNMGWIKSLRKGSTGIGYTFEALIGKVEDASSFPDFEGIEIKTHRRFSKSDICLFNYNPIGESSYELMRIYDSYGYRSLKDKSIKVLNTSVYCDWIRDVGINYKFSLKIDYDSEKVYLMVFDRLGNFIEKKSFWKFSTLRDKLYSKMRYLAYIEAYSKFFEGVEFFKYNYIKFYKLKGFDTFIDLLFRGKIRVTFKVGVYTSGPRCGEINSHGTSFSIKSCDLGLLYEPIII